MKKLLFILMTWFFASGMMAQNNNLHVSGYITDSLTGNPVAYHPVHIDIDSASGGFTYHHEIKTLANGFFEDEIPLNPVNIQTGILQVKTNDCLHYPHLVTFRFGQGNMNFTVAFIICTENIPPTCHSDFHRESDPSSPMAVHFVNTSVGSNGPWNWLFDDGTTSDLFDPVHTYTAAGLYHVTLQIGDSLNGGCFDSKTKEIRILGDSTGNGCHADFSWRIDSSATSPTVHFTTLNNAAGVSWDWNFGDSTFSSEQNPTHTYAQNGEYHVCLTITNSNPACQDMKCKVVHVGTPPPPPCESWFTYHLTGLNVSFEGHMPVNQSAEYTWNFGDGIAGSGKNIDHLFAAPGTYPVTLTTVLQDTNHCTWTSTRQIYVGDTVIVNCLANFYAQPEPTSPKTLHFVNTSIGSNGPWNWLFDDGTTSDLFDPVHTYTAAGLYHVTLQIGDSLNGGCFDSKTKEIRILGDSTGNGCHADFSWRIDSSATSPTVHFTTLNNAAGVSWYWSFGDSTFSSEQNPTHTYAQNGEYHVCLTITNSNPACQDMKCKVVHVGTPPPPPCESWFTYHRTGLNVSFEGHMPVNQSAEYTWNFGDGTAGSGKNIDHLFAAPGTYPVTLTTVLQDTNHCSWTSTRQIYVGDTVIVNCLANFYAQPEPTSSKTLHFVNTSVGSNGPWNWLFDDGTTSDLFDPVHTYTAAGLYHVTLQIGDSLSGGCFDSKTKEIRILGDSTGNGCHADFSWRIDSSATSPTVHFTTLNNAAGVSWYWNFGDSTFSSEQNPTHTYAQNGEYQVCLTIANSDPACQDMKCKVVHVGTLPPQPCESWFNHMTNWLHVSFEGHMPMHQPATYTWNFGDGKAGTGKNIEHEYAVPGLYSVTLTTVSQNTSQCLWTSTQEIRVGDSTNIHQVYGQVFAGNVPVHRGKAMIFGIDTTKTNPPFFAISFLSQIGAYLFPYVPDGDFVIYALPADSAGNYLPTFYGDVIYWEQATVVHIGQPQNPYNINLVHTAPAPQGPGGISGHVSNQGLKASQVGQITMLLTNEQGHPVSFRMVDPSGSFDFSRLAYGTYYLRPVLPNTNSDIIKVVLTAANPVANVLMTLDGNNLLGVKDIPLVESFISYPNPVKDLLYIGLNVVSPVSGIAVISTMSGQAVARKSFTLTRGSNQIQMNVDMLSHGIYLLRITSPEGINIVQKIIK